MSPNKYEMLFYLFFICFLSHLCFYLEPPTVSSSSSIQNFAANKDRSPQSHLSTRPHLASPGEFMTSSKAPFGKEAGKKYRVVSNIEAF